MQITLSNGTVLQGQAAEMYVREAARGTVEETMKRSGGKPVELKETQKPQPPEVTEAQVVGAFVSLGLTEAEAKVAARGRG